MDKTGPEYDQWVKSMNQYHGQHSQFHKAHDTSGVTKLQ